MTDDSIFGEKVTQVKKVAAPFVMSEEAYVILSAPMGADNGERRKEFVIYYPPGLWAEAQERARELAEDAKVPADAAWYSSVDTAELAEVIDDDLWDDMKLLERERIFKLTVTCHWTEPPEKRRPSETDGMTESEYVNHLLRKSASRLFEWEFGNGS